MKTKIPLIFFWEETIYFFISPWNWIIPLIMIQKMKILCID